jgi:hypothetical protein
MSIIRKVRAPIAHVLTLVFLALVARTGAVAAAPQTYYFFVFSNPVSGQED